MTESSRYTVGIDLGTTNTVVSYFETEADFPRIQLLPIEQHVEAGVVEDREQLPSFLYQPLAQEREENPSQLAWENNAWVGGVYARDRGAEVPNRFVSSAKSWLCQSGVDRKEAFLPFGSEEEVEKISPFEATCQYLRHVSGNWRNKMGCLLSDQAVIITVPASFDEQARKLTEEAAKSLGLEHLTILEEPLAALYAWVSHQGDGWRNEVEQGDVILVCDVGGGTSDFSLITVADDGGNLGLKRTAVGEHILLGGDNMDLALAYQAKAKMEQKKKLSSWQLRGLWYQARKIKEDILSGKTNNATFTVLGSGIKKLIGGTLKAEFSFEEINHTLTEGFFPACTIDEHPSENVRSGVKEIGLPYASDAAVTRHLARFIARNANKEDFKWPNKILFNGGVFNCEAMRDRVTNVINSWLSEMGQPLMVPLNYSSLDHSVALGASYYGWSRLGKGIRIRAGIPRSYYIEVESSMPAIPGFPAPKKACCIAPFGMEEGSDVALESETFALRTGEPVQFTFLASNLRQEDQSGEVIEDWDEDEIEEAHKMEITLDSEPGMESPIPVQLGAKVTEVGTLELYFKNPSTGKRWTLEYQVRETETV